MALFVVFMALSLRVEAAGPPRHGAPAPGRETLPPPTIALPKLLTLGFHEPADVCADARKNGKRLVIVAVKSHICDCEPSVQFCMHVTRALSDPCLPFLGKHFAVYHTRWSRYPDFTKGECETLPGAQEVDDAWRAATKEIGSGPGIFILDAEKCRAIAKIGAGEASRLEDPLKRRAATRKLVADALARITAPTDAVREALADKDLECSGEEKSRYVAPSLRQVWEALETQTREAK